ncbi:MAG: site-specific integrase [Sulfitobacter sp.]
MASIRRIKSGWQVQVARKGVRKSATFATKMEAKDWAAREEHLILTGQEHYGSGTVKQLFLRYAKDESPKKGGVLWETARLARFAEDEWAQIDLADVRSNDIASWRDRRLNEVKPGTVMREMNLLSVVFSTAIRDWGLLSINPVKGVGRPKAPPARERRVTQAEVDRLVATAGVDLLKIKGRAVHAFRFAIETAMRAGEILALRRDDVNGRVARLHTSKNGKGRDVPLSLEALRLWEMLPGDGFEMTSRQLDPTFRKMRVKAKIEGLTFHDSRHEAITRLAGKVHVMALAKIVGHENISQLMTYYDEAAEDIATRLD